MIKIGDWFFVPYYYVFCGFDEINVGREVLISQNGTICRMRVTNKRLHGISGEVLDIISECDDRDPKRES